MDKEYIDVTIIIGKRRCENGPFITETLKQEYHRFLKSPAVIELIRSAIIRNLLSGDVHSIVID